MAAAILLVQLSGHLQAVQAELLRMGEQAPGVLQRCILIQAQSHLLTVGHRNRLHFDFLGSQLRFETSPKT